MKSERYLVIDVLRGIAIFFVILLHTNAYFLHNKTAYLVWDYGQFAVPVFIFCSSYIFFQRKEHHHYKYIISYFKKRFFRLVIPYYAFLVIVFFLMWKKHELWSTYVWQSIFLYKGVDINWLVLLFLQFSILMPLLAYIENKIKPVFFLYVVFALGSSVWLMFSPISLDYRFVMWLPWSLFIIFSLYFIRYEKQKLFLAGGVIFSLFVFFLLRYIQIKTNHSLIMFNNKYPPNLYHISYGVLSVFVLYVLTERNVFSWFPVNKIFHFLSRYSFSLYFIHWLVIDVIFKFYYDSVFSKLNWEGFFIVVFVISIFIQWILKEAGKRFTVFQHYTRARRFGYLQAREG